MLKKIIPVVKSLIARPISLDHAIDRAHEIEHLLFIHKNNTQRISELEVEIAHLKSFINKYNK